MTRPFQPKGDRALWEEVFLLAQDAEPGTVLTFDDLSAVLGYDVSAQGSSRTPILRASDRLLESRNKVLTSVRGVGYRVVEPSEQEGLARGRQRRARRQIAKGVSLVVNVDRNALTIEQRASVDALCQVLTAQNAMLRRHDRRIGTVERTVQEVDSRVTVMEALLRRHGIDLPQGRTIEGEIVPET